MEENEKILEENWWIINCQSPFEISNEWFEARATGIRAEIVLEYYKNKSKNNLQNQIISSFLSNNNK